MAIAGRILYMIQRGFIQRVMPLRSSKQGVTRTDGMFSLRISYMRTVFTSAPLFPLPWQLLSPVSAGHTSVCSGLTIQDSITSQGASLRRRLILSHQSLAACSSSPRGGALRDGMPTGVVI